MATTNITWVNNSVYTSQKFYYGQSSVVGVTNPPGAGWTEIAILPNATSQIVDGLADNTSYTYVIQSYCGATLAGTLRLVQTTPGVVIQSGGNLYFNITPDIVTVGQTTRGVVSFSPHPSLTMTGQKRIYITKDPKYTLGFNNTWSIANSNPYLSPYGVIEVENDIWTLDAISDPNRYIFTTSSPLYVNMVSLGLDFTLVAAGNISLLAELSIIPNSPFMSSYTNSELMQVS